MSRPPRKIGVVHDTNSLEAHHDRQYPRRTAADQGRCRPALGTGADRTLVPRTQLHVARACARSRHDRSCFSAASALRQHGLRPRAAPVGPEVQRRSLLPGPGTFARRAVRAPADGRVSILENLSRGSGAVVQPSRVAGRWVELLDAGHSRVACGLWSARRPGCGLWLSRGPSAGVVSCRHGAAGAGDHGAVADARHGAGRAAASAHASRRCAGGRPWVLFVCAFTRC